MRIGIDCHNLEDQRTGVGRYLWNLLKEWVKLSGSHPDSFGAVEFFLYFKNEIPRDVYELISKKASWTLTLLGINSNAFFKHWRLPKAAARDGVDVLFCPDYVLPFYVGRRIKTAVTIHDIIYEARPSEYSWPSRSDKILLKWASKQSAKTADIIFVPSEFTKNEILKYYKVNPEKVVVTPLAPDPIFRKIPTLTKGGLGGVGKLILFVGSIFNRRFLPEKIQGFIEFVKTYKDFTFLIIGKNHTKPYQNIGALLAEATTRLGREAVIWKERASDEELVYLYNAAFATLWLSSYEGFGLPILESIACGTPVITAKSGSWPEVAGDAALYINNPQDPREIANALCRLARDRGYYDSLVKSGLFQAQKFSWQKTATQTIYKILAL